MASTQRKFVTYRESFTEYQSRMRVVQEVKAEKTGKSRATYYRVKKRLIEERGAGL